jgi:hypothetical protein
MAEAVEQHTTAMSLCAALTNSSCIFTRSTLSGVCSSTATNTCGSNQQKQLAVSQPAITFPQHQLLREGGNSNNSASLLQTCCGLACSEHCRQHARHTNLSAASWCLPHSCKPYLQQHAQA